MKTCFVARTELQINDRTAISRTLFIPSGYTLGDLHIMLQAAHGWFSYHNHIFQIGKDDYEVKGKDCSPFNGVLNADKTPLESLLNVNGRETKIDYKYDFGDGWEVTVMLSKAPDHFITSAEASFAPETVVPFCFAGRHGDPVEDCGGTSGYERLAAKPKPLRDWLESQGQPDWNPKVCEMSRINGFLVDFFSTVKPGNAGGIFSEGTKAIRAWRKALYRAYPTIERAEAA